MKQIVKIDIRKYYKMNSVRNAVNTHWKFNVHCLRS